MLSDVLNLEIGCVVALAPSNLYWILERVITCSRANAKNTHAQRLRTAERGKLSLAFREDHCDAADI
jgi:hypothetical protein